MRHKPLPWGGPTRPDQAALHGIDLDIQTGKGSGVSAQRVGAGASKIGIADITAKLETMMDSMGSLGDRFYSIASEGTEKNLTACDTFKKLSVSIENLGKQQAKQRAALAGSMSAVELECVGEGINRIMTCATSVTARVGCSLPNFVALMISF